MSKNIKKYLSKFAGELLKEQLEKVNQTSSDKLSLSKIASQIYLSKSLVAHFVSGRRSPKDLDVLIQVLEIFQFEPDEFAQFKILYGYKEGLSPNNKNDLEAFHKIFFHFQSQKGKWVLDVLDYLSSNFSFLLDVNVYDSNAFKALLYLKREDFKTARDYFEIICDQNSDKSKLFYQHTILLNYAESICLQAKSYEKKYYELKKSLENQSVDEHLQSEFNETCICLTRLFEQAKQIILDSIEAFKVVNPEKRFIDAEYKLASIEFHLAYYSTPDNRSNRLEIALNIVEETIERFLKDELNLSGRPHFLKQLQYMKVQTLVFKGQFDRALDLVNSGLTFNPNIGWLWAYKAMVFSQPNFSLDEGKLFLQHALNLSPRLEENLKENSGFIPYFV